MRTWTKSACVVLAWSILPATLVAIGMTGSVRPALANTRTTSSTEVTLTSTLNLAAPSPAATSIAAPAPAAASPATRYVVQPGDTLSGIAARLGVHGGWPSLYVANRHAIGRDPNGLRPGTALMAPGHRTLAHYRVGAGDTLARIAAALRLRGGWKALYAANEPAIGPDPNAIRPGTVLAIPGPASSRARASGPSHGRPTAPMPSPSPPPPPPGSLPHHARPVTNQPRPVTHGSPVPAGMPPWLKFVLLAVGLLILVALGTEPVLASQRRRQPAAIQAPQPGPAGAGGEPARPPSAAKKACIVLADHDRLVVTCSKRDDTVYVLRPPGEDPRSILRVARLVLPEFQYGELAKQLGMPAIGPVE